MRKQVTRGHVLGGDILLQSHLSLLATLSLIILSAVMSTLSFTQTSDAGMCCLSAIGQKRWLGGIFTVCMVRALLSHVIHARACCYYCSTYTSWPNQVDTSSHNLSLALGEVPQDGRRSTDIPSFRKVADHLSRGAKPKSERINCFWSPTLPPHPTPYLHPASK